MRLGGFLLLLDETNEKSGILLLYHKPFCTYGTKCEIVREFNAGFLNGKA